LTTIELYITTKGAEHKVNKQEDQTFNQLSRQYAASYMPS